MFKIRSLRIDDFEKLEVLLKDKPYLEVLKQTPIHRIMCLAQNIVPHNLRFLPSVHLATHEKNMLGVIVLQCISKVNNCWQINEVFVLDEVRQKGIGEELVRYVLSVYGGHGVEHFLAEVDSQNFPALSLFHQCGFRRYAKVCFYEKEIDIGTVQEKPLFDKDFILRPQTVSDLLEIEKIELSSIPPDLRPVLGRSKEYFKEKRNTFVLLDKSRNLIIGWAQIQRVSGDYQFIELLLSPGWTHLYEQFLNTLIFDRIAIQSNKFKLTVKAADYLTELTETLSRLGFLETEVKELLVRTIWQKVKERKKKAATISVPSTAPT